MEKPLLSFQEISDRLLSTQLPEVDLVIGISRGGTTLACLTAHQLRCDLEIVSINYRDDSNIPRYDAPRLLSGSPRALAFTGSILLVDDVSVSGKTLAFAKSHLASNKVTTLVGKGNGDLVLFPEVKNCVRWPWSTTIPVSEPY